MPWSASWKSNLSSDQIEPVLIADVGILSWFDPGDFSTSILGSSFASHRWIPDAPATINTAHMLTDLRMSGQSVTLRTWDVKRGGFSFGLTSTQPGALNLPFTPNKGMNVQIRAGFGSGSVWSMEVIARGMIDNITRDGDTWWVQCRDIMDTLRSRPSARADDITPAVTDPPQLFEGTDQAVNWTTITGGPGWDSGAGANLPVHDLKVFDKDARTGAVGVARIDGSADGDPWYFVYSAKSAATGAGTLTAAGSASWFGNTDTENYPAGTKVYNVGVITGKPWNVAARILRSTGAESSTGFDTLPLEWGLGLSLGFVDSEDILAMEDHPAMLDRAPSTPAPLTPTWTPFVMAPVDDGYQLIAQGLAQFNMWMVALEDQISIRMAYDYRASEFSAVVSDSIDDDWIASIDGHDLYHPDASVEYHKVGGASDAVGNLYSLKGSIPLSRPWLVKFNKTIANNGLTVSGSENVPDGMTAWEAGTSAAKADSRTLTTNAHTWYTRIPELLSITTRTLRYAPLVPGDLVSVTSDHIIGRDGMYKGKTCMVTGVIPDWMAGTVKLDLAVLPKRNTG